jgi:hypothetical protein
MQKSIILIGAAIGILIASSAGAKTHGGWRGTIEGWFAAHDKRMCRWDAPPAGGTACRITEIREQNYSRASAVDRLNGWEAKQEIRFDAAYYNGQLWSEAYNASAIFVKTRDGWRLRYSSMGNGESEAIPVAGAR